MEEKRTILECVGPCIEKIKEHAELKELYKKLAEREEKRITDILPEKIEDYHKKMKSYIKELVEEIKAYRETYENLSPGKQKEEVKQDLEDLERELYCCIYELFELYHYFRTLEELSDQHIEQALNIPGKLIYELLLELRGVC
ncbi:hypothetical protein BCF55_0860 [Hydrogenivirga caldilitoris]|uniref:Uncharacterized protein n=1 Tax=Hydrogenivirga caldilitoris TaxID=246264 RepID=A0A497XQQ3_9AQUI|nr:hypothetical protein [Hydrogenivirga caldilitoris]RLJ70584.1 hypothetical protein BCF55_0860 [Hydrogenivirga caldilitoris]